MSRRKAHNISDSEEDEETKPQPKKANREQPKRRPKSFDEKASDSEQPDQVMDIVPAEQNEEVCRTPVAFKVLETASKGSRKEQHRLFVYLIDRSPSEEDNLENYVPYIVKRNLADNYMRLKFEPKVHHHCLVMNCCDADTNNLSNREQPRDINQHCVEVISAGKITIKKITDLHESFLVSPEPKQHSNVMAGLFTVADIFNRSSEDFDGYSETEIMLFSDLLFDRSDASVAKIRKILARILNESKLIVVADRDRLKTDDFLSNFDILKEISPDCQVFSYQEAMKKSEQWTMKEQVPMKFNASIKLFDQELSTEAYLVCSEKNESILQNKLEKLDDSSSSFGVSESLLRQKKQLVKLTEDGHYEKGSDGNLVLIDPDRSTMAFRFGTTAVPTEKNLKEYVDQKDSHKGYVVKGWYPADQFPLYVSGGRAYRVFSSSSDSTTFDSLLKLCAEKNRALLVDYAYASRFEAKPGVLIPHLKKHCFVFYDLIYGDSVNYLPRYDPIATGKPELEHLKKISQVIGSLRVTSLEMKYDPQSQQIFENAWESCIDEMPRKFVDKLADVPIDKESDLRVEANAFSEKLEGYLKRFKTKQKLSDDNVDDKIAFHVDVLDDRDIEKIEPEDFGKLFASD